MSHVSFSLVKKQQVLGTLKATGSRDHDVLFAAKQSMLEPVKPLKIFGIWGYVTGALSTAMIILAPIGIPLIIFGWWVRRRAKRNIETIEATFSEYVQSLRTGAAAA